MSNSLAVGLDVPVNHGAPDLFSYFFGQIRGMNSAYNFMPTCADIDIDIVTIYMTIVLYVVQRWAVAQPIFFKNTFRE
jgi:hypothetical protein